MDSGKLTDTNGKVADFRNAIIIMTSNAGAREVAKPGIGIEKDSKSNRALNAVKNLFAPEFINRLDAIVPFDALSKPIVMQVIEKFLSEFAAQLKEKKVHITVTDKAKDWLFEHGYDAAYGARPLGRTIDENVKKKLVDQLLFGELEQGGNVTVDVEKDEIVVK
jgi:ATP-dependent Clp protease ATP-binding subunit ClpA